MNQKVEQLQVRGGSQIWWDRVVTIAENGFARVVAEVDGKNPLQVTHHANGVDWLEVGDEVCVRITATKVIVEYRMLAVNDKLRRFFKGDDVQFNANRALTLECGESNLKLLPDGKIIINAREIKALADETLALQGASIRLNCED